MKTKYKSSILLIALMAMMFVNVGTFTTAKRDAPKTSAAPALNVGTEQSFSFTNDSQIKVYRMNWTADKIYKLSLTNDKGCSLKAKVWYPDSKVTYNIPVFYGENEYGSYLPNIDGDIASDMGVTSGTEWNQTTEDFYFKTFMNLSIIIHIYSDARNNSIAYEDLGGKVKVSDVTATFLDQSNMDITAGWSSSITNPDPGFKYKKVFLNESGLYQFELTSNENNTLLDAYFGSPISLDQELIGSVYDTNDTDIRTVYAMHLANYEKLFLPAGNVYLKASTSQYGSSWNLDVSKLVTPVVPHNGSFDFEFKISEAWNYTSIMGNIFYGEHNFIVDGLEYNTLYEYSIDCPEGYDADLFGANPSEFAESGTEENTTESGEFLVSPNALPMYQNINGYDFPNTFRLLKGIDENINNDAEKPVERFYGSQNIMPNGGFLETNGSNYYLLMNLWFYNTSKDFEDQTITVSVDKAATQPKTLKSSPTTYTFNHISDNDDEGIYKLNTNHTGNVLGFLMTNMGDNSSVSMSALSNRFNDELGLDLGVMGEGGFSPSLTYSWNNDTYEDNNYDKYWREVALLSDGYVILQDGSMSNSFPYQNTTQFTMKYDVFPAVNLSQEFTKQRGRDLVLLRAEMDYNTSIHARAVSGIPNLDENAPLWMSYFGFTEDGVYQVATSEYGGTEKDMTSWFASMKATYYMPIIMDTSDGRTNIGTFKFTSTGTIPDVTGFGAIPGYPIFITLSISVFVIGIIAYLQRKRNL